MASDDLEEDIDALLTCQTAIELAVGGIRLLMTRKHPNLPIHRCWFSIGPSAEAVVIVTFSRVV